MMNRYPLQVDAWPRLAWVASAGPNVKRMDVHHGPVVVVDLAPCLRSVLTWLRVDAATGILKALLMVSIKALIPWRALRHLARYLDGANEVDVGRLLDQILPPLPAVPGNRQWISGIVAVLEERRSPIRDDSGSYHRPGCRFTSPDPPGSGGMNLLIGRARRQR